MSCSKFLALPATRHLSCDVCTPHEGHAGWRTKRVEQTGEFCALCMHPAFLGQQGLQLPIAIEEAVPHILLPGVMSCY
jgi:hypothetical protein